MNSALNPASNPALSAAVTALVHAAVKPDVNYTEKFRWFKYTSSGVLTRSRPGSCTRYFSLGLLI